MKFKTTQKAIKQNYDTIKIGYCNLQTMLTYRAPIAYTTRAEGWGADIYDIGMGCAIATGYAPFGKIKPSWELQRKYEDRAQKILYESKSYEDSRAMLDDLIVEFREEVCGR